MARVEVETSKVSSQILEVDYTLSMTNDIDAIKYAFNSPLSPTRWHYQSQVLYVGFLN
jgi:hypothetical protein